MIEAPFARAESTGSSARVETDDPEACHSRESISSLRKNVTIHHPAMRWKWMQGDHRRMGGRERISDLADQSKAIFGPDRELFAARR
jgi:hypothetical protein